MVKYTLTEFSYLTGRGRLVGSADSAARLDWERCDALNTYSVEKDGKAIAEFEGCDVWTARAWLLANPGYDGSFGVHVWRGQCDLCDGAGQCDCEGSIWFAV